MALLARLGEALLVESCVDRVCTDVAGMELAPELAEANVVLAAAERAGPMSRREGRRLVEEEELREAAGLQQSLAAPAAELEPARDPALAAVAATDLPGRVVEAAAIAVHEASGWVGDQFAERCDPVPERQRS
jgi:hypothetical protein